MKAADLRNPLPLTLDPTAAALATELGFYIEDRGGIQVLVFLSQGCHPANGSEVALWQILLATSSSLTSLRSALTGSPHKASCEVDRLRLALNKSNLEVSK